MNGLPSVKLLVVFAWGLASAAAFALAGGAWGALAVSTHGTSAPAQQQPTPSADYVGTDTCSGCHDAQHGRFMKTPHAVLERDPSWKGKVVGCESCHGPGARGTVDGNDGQRHGPARARR